MADTLTSIQAQIVNKNKAAVEQLLGTPVKKGYWTTSKPPDGANAAAITAFKKAALDEIWIYASGRVHFNLAGTAIKVDDKTNRDLPPEQMLV